MKDCQLLSSYANEVHKLAIGKEIIVQTQRTAKIIYGSKTWCYIYSIWKGYLGWFELL